MAKIIIIFFVIFALILLSSCASVVENEPGSIAIHFCPQENCTQLFAQQLASAKVSLDCALYDIDGAGAWDAIDNTVKRVPTRIVMDSDYKKEAQNRTSAEFIHFDTNSGLMHNKFCIMDGQIVTGGSMNPTVNDQTKNFNNFITINATGIAKNYKTEFEELWGGQFRKGTKNKQTQFIVNGTRVEQYFCPEDNCEQHVIEQINAANESIKFMTFSFTSSPIGYALIQAHERGIVVEGLYEKRQVNAYSVFSPLTTQGIKTAVAINPNKGQLHHKVFIIDNETVITGSYNPTKNGNQGNDENIIIIHSEQLAQQFLQNYASIYAQSSQVQPKSLSQ